MSDFAPAAGRIETAYQKFRMWIGVAGVVAIVTGAVILAWPSIAVNVLAVVIGAYAIVAGAVYLGVAIFSKELATLSKTWRGVAGAALIALGVIALLNIDTTQDLLIWVIAIVVGVSWIAEGILTLMGAIRSSNTNPFFLVYGVLSILAGIAVGASPLYQNGIELLRWLFGLSFVILGAAQIVRIIVLGRRVAAVQQVIE